MRPLVLSLFPGLDLLGRGFGIEGACVVAGPDVVWGGDIRGWHAPPGRFDGVIGGPPCQTFSPLAALGRAQGHEPRFGNLIPEFERVVSEAHPHWFVMEEVPLAPLPEVDGYDIWCALIRHNDLGGAQLRQRRISFGLRVGRWQSLASPFTLLEYRPKRASSEAVRGDHGQLPASARRHSVTTSGTTPRPRSVTASSGGATKHPRTDGGEGDVKPMIRMSIPEMLELQDAPPDLLDESPFTADGKRSLIGNAVPVLMARAIARMAAAALEEDWGS